MRRAMGWVAMLAAMVVARPARPDSPAALRVMAGIGVGTGGVGTSSISPTAGALAADLLLPTAPGRAMVLSYEVGGVESHEELRAIEEAGWRSTQITHMDHWSVLAGIERDRVKRWTSSFIQGGVGLGAIVEGPVRSRVSHPGLAVSGAWGLSIVPPPGPIGLLLALRTSHLIAVDAHTSLLAVSLGLTFHPR